MKRTTFASAVLSLMMACSTVGLGQSKAKARVKPPVKGGGQICTGCCDPCYSDDWWKIRQPQSNAPNAKATKSTRARKGNR
ncbi:MAG: hypothetical protein HYR56_20690 [Acidobacteria bacterium]|nr:hypothetical protein [Acidobacteriota bacterium]MBI3423180.1 hypothetical protein [Acidobacteriota bacterium]